MREKIRQEIEKLIVSFKNHGTGYLLALLVGIASIAPYLLAQYALGDDYKGFPLLFTANEDYYIARVQDIVDGHRLLGSPFLYEYKNNLPMVFPIGEFIYALPALLFGVSVLSVVMTFKFIFPTILFLIVYFLIYNLSKRATSDKITACFGGLLITLGSEFVNYKQVWLLLTGQSQDLFLSLWTRPVNPITGALFLFLFLILLWKSINSDKWFYFVIAGVVLGLMPGYIFSWLSAMSIIGATILLSLFRCRFGVIKKLCTIVLCSILVSAPSWYIWLSALFTSADNNYMAFHHGLLLTHYPIFNKVVLLQTVFFLPLFLFIRYKAKKRCEEAEEWWWFTASLVVGNWLVFNQQIITGRVVWPPHLTQYTIPLVFLTFVLVFGNYFKTRAPKLCRTAIVVFGGIIILYTIMATFSYRLDSQMRELATVQRFIPLFAWLNQQTQKDCVVLAKESKKYAEPLGDWIPALTHCNTYSSTNSVASLERTYFNYLVELRLRGIKEQDLEQYLWDNREELRYQFYTTWLQWYASAGDDWLSGPISTIINKYHDFLKEDFTIALRRYQIDYLVSDESLFASPVNQFPNARLLDKVGVFYIYQL